LGSITEEQYDSIFNANVKGLPLHRAESAGPHAGRRVDHPDASVVGSKGLPDWSVYSATKAAVRSFARTWTTDLKARRIRVNAVSPGYTDTPPWHSIEGAEERMKIHFQQCSAGQIWHAR